ncbi:MAG: hypothetical protein ABIT36_02420 [Steroidobacteraceae bacterium]
MRAHKLFASGSVMGALAALLLAGCVTQETKPIAKINPLQSQQQIANDDLLDIAVQVFDPGIPPELAMDEEALAKKRIYPDLRKAEARFIPAALRNTLESSAQWGAVRVVPETVEFVDVIVSGRILASTGKHLAVEISAQDASGREWIAKKRYESEADLGSYKTDASLRVRDPFQNVYSNIANDLVQARDKLEVAERREVRRIAQLRFASDLAPEAMGGYLAKQEVAKDAKSGGLVRVARLPAENDPLIVRIDRIRDRDAAVIDTLDGYYVGFSEQMRESYGSFRRTSYEEIDKEERARASARTRTLLGVAAVAASIFVPSNCNSTASCNLQSAARYGGAAGGIAGILSGFKKYADARTHAQSFKELATSFQSEVSTQVIDVEGRSLKLTGTAEEQYREWRSLLKEFHQQESAPPPPAADVASAAPAL